MDQSLKVELVFVAPESQAFHVLELPQNSTVATAIAASGLTEQFSQYPINELPVGIWGRQVTHEQLLQTGDRIEVYRELLLDPMEARRLRALGPVPDPCESP